MPDPSAFEKSDLIPPQVESPSQPGGAESVEGPPKVDLGGDGIMRFQDLAWLKNQLRAQGLHIVGEEEHQALKTVVGIVADWLEVNDDLEVTDDKADAFDCMDQIETALCIEVADELSRRSATKAIPQSRFELASASQSNGAGKEYKKKET